MPGPDNMRSLWPLYVLLYTVSVNLSVSLHHLKTLSSFSWGKMWYTSHDDDDDNSSNDDDDVDGDCYFLLAALETHPLLDYFFSDLMNWQERTGSSKTYSACSKSRSDKMFANNIKRNKNQLLNDNTNAFIVMELQWICISSCFFIKLDFQHRWWCRYQIIWLNRVVGQKKLNTDLVFYFVWGRSITELCNQF